MDTLFEKYKTLNINSTLISLEWADNYTDYFCYPLNAKAIGFEGCIMYCFIDGYDDMVFASNPESCADINVYPLAKNFEDFIRLILACGSANPVEQVIWMSKEKFEEHLKSEKALFSEEQRLILRKLKKEFNVLPMENPFEYVKEIQNDFDGSKIQYSDEYYDILGIEG